MSRKNWACIHGFEEAAMSTPPERPAYTTPRWVKGCAIAAAVVVVALIVMLLSGHSPTRHMHGHAPVAVSATLP